MGGTFAREQAERARVQQLHLVGYTTDLDALIFSARKGAKSGSYVIPLDEAVLSKIDEALQLRNGRSGESHSEPRSRAKAAAARPESSLTPKQIQHRLRSGHSIAEVASEAGVDDEWVARFAAPIVAEQIQVMETAQALHLMTPRKGESAEPLGASVERNLESRGVPVDDDEEVVGQWDAHHIRGASWLVGFEFRSRGRLQRAEWELDVAANELHPRNRLATDLGYVEAVRRRRSAPTPAARKRTRRSVRPAPRKPPAKSAAAIKKAAVAKKAAAKKAAVKKAAAKKAAAQKVATEKAAAKRLAAQRTAAKRAMARL
ncbi:MAG: hypothetical protein QOG87_2682, partial [Actinomycetota bacterium]